MVIWELIWGCNYQQIKMANNTLVNLIFWTGCNYEYQNMLHVYSVIISPCLEEVENGLIWRLYYVHDLRPLLIPIFLFNLVFVCNSFYLKASASESLRIKKTKRNFWIDGWKQNVYFHRRLSKQSLNLEQSLVQFKALPCFAIFSNISLSMLPRTIKHQKQIVVGRK